MCILVMAYSKTKEMGRERGGGKSGFMIGDGDVHTCVWREGERGRERGETDRQTEKNRVQKWRNRNKTRF